MTQILSSPRSPGLVPLLSSRDITYSYDAVGNRLTKVEDGARTTYAYDAANQIETEEDASGTTTYTFDDNGNLQVENAGGDRTTYTWDIENMCVGIVLPDDSLNIFAYDGDLVRREAEDSDGLVKFVNDEQNVLLETDSGGTTQVAYTLEPAGYGNLVSQRRSGATSWHLFDGLGSTDRLLDSSETEEASYINTAFGVPKAVTGNHANRLRFVGRLGYRWEPDTGQYDVRRRRLDPARGRWIARDPLSSGTRLYVYVANSPLGREDPSGLVCQASGFSPQLSPGPCAENVVTAPIGWPDYCHIQHEVVWWLEWYLPSWDDDADCAVYQVMSNDFGPWEKDARQGWPYGHTCVTIGTRQRCYQQDNPRWETSVSRLVRSAASYITEFLTCLCAKDPNAGPLPLACYSWVISACEVNCQTCNSLYCNEVGPGADYDPAAMAIIQRACLDWYLR